MGVAAVVPRGELTAERLASAVRRALGDRAVAERVPVVSARLRAAGPCADRLLPARHAANLLRAPPGAIVLFLGEAGDLPPPAEAARTVVAAHLCHPHAILTLAIGGFDDDPREVCGIPEAKAFYAGLAAALAEYPCAESLTKALATSPRRPSWPSAPAGCRGMRLSSRRRADGPTRSGDDHR